MSVYRITERLASFGIIDLQNRIKIAKDKPRDTIQCLCSKIAP
ncbi:hypothetical protein VAEU17_250075 [Vibrio aestuarianus]|nr:hypothetical protein VAEU17_250075 [Vibrio aestuarianus]